MFFELVSRNSKRNRKENRLFFSSLLITVIAFYLILSLSRQDVMLFLADMESDAVNRVLSMIPLFYGITLFILFFLVYFASKYQLEGRKHEFGIYLMTGMSSSKLFFLLLAEDIKNSLNTLLLGLPIAIVISELISLLTAKLVGLGIIGHRLSLSVTAIIWTVAGFLIIKLAAFLILSRKIAHQEIGDLLHQATIGSKKQLPFVVYVFSLIMGIILLGAAYAMAICGFSWSSYPIMAITLVCGLLGTILIFFGLRCTMEFFAKKNGNVHKLHIFTFRQLQENVIHKSFTLTISSLLLLAALCCFGIGIAIAAHYSDSGQHTIDYTFYDEENVTDIQSELTAKGLDPSLFGDIFEMKVGYIQTEMDDDKAYSMDSVMNLLEQQKDSTDKEILLNNLSYETDPRLISLSGYNHLLSLAGVPEIKLGEKEAAVYMDADFTAASRTVLLNQILETKPAVQIREEPFLLTGTVQNHNLVVDRSITLAFALIVSDDVFDRMTSGNYDIYQNTILNPDQTFSKSLLAAVADTNLLLDHAGIRYESYLQNIGRQLFYVVSAGYITIYLAIVFFVIANTVIGIQFLTQQQQNERRYRALIRIGASYQSLCHSSCKQINWYFGIPVILSAVSSIFGIQALFSGLPSIQTPDLMVISFTTIVLFSVIEYVYMSVVKKSGSKYLLSLMDPEREE